MTKKYFITSDEIVYKLNNCRLLKV